MEYGDESSRENLCDLQRRYRECMYPNFQKRQILRNVETRNVVSFYGGELVIYLINTVLYSFHSYAFEGMEIYHILVSNN